MRRRFESLLSAGVAIFSEHSLERVLQQIVDSAREVVGARYAALGVLAPDRATLSQFVTSGLSQAERERIGDLPRGRGLLGLVIREAQPIRSADIDSVGYVTGVEGLMRSTLLSEHAPIHVLGAGPSGLAAALTANRTGRRVIVHERSSEVGHRFHDDFQGLENWTTDGDVIDELAALGIEPTFDHTPIRETVVFDARRVHTYRSPQPFFYLVRRGAGEGTLDSSLKAQALARGIEIRFGEARRPLPERGVVAEGPRGTDAIAVGYVFATKAADGAFGAMSDALAPKGYAYLLMTRGRGTVASCMFDDFRNKSAYLDRTVAFFREQVGFDMQNPQRFGGAGSVRVPQTARRGDLLFVGEAAGFQDGLWGFGMRYAMLSGSLAARSLVSGRLEDYDRLWRERLGGLLRTGIVNRFIYGKLGARGYRGLAWLLDRASDPRALLGRLYRPSLLTRLLYPIARQSITASLRANAARVR